MTWNNSARGQGLIINLLVIYTLFFSGLIWADSNNTATSATVAKQAPNILLILTDNQSAEALSIYGNRDVKTPNLEKLAQQGTRFTNSFAVNGLCSATRATLMTGLMPSQHGVHDALNPLIETKMPQGWNAVKEYRTLPQTLKNRGYDTAMIGKWHLGRTETSHIGFDYWLTFVDGHTWDFWHNTIVDNGDTYDVNDKHIVDFFTEKAVDYIAKHDGEKPFFLQLSLDGPYALPDTNLGPARNRFYEDYAGKEFLSRYEGPADDDHMEQLGKSEQQILDDYEAQSSSWFNRTLKDIAKNRWVFDLVSSVLNEEQIEWLVRYFWNLQLATQVHMVHDPDSYANFMSQNAMVDDSVGRVMAALEAANLRENTLVIYTSDQGNLFGQHGAWGHTTTFRPSRLYNGQMNIPLVVSHPGVVAQGVTSEQMIGQYDLMPTILDYAGFAQVDIENSPGRSFTPSLKGHEQSDWGELVYFEQEQTRGVRTPKFAYWKRLSGHGENVLYDMSQAGNEQDNLINDPAYAQIVKTLDSKLVAFFNQYSDAEFDLWNAGTAKGSSLQTDIWRTHYGEQWAPVLTERSAFVE